MDGETKAGDAALEDADKRRDELAKRILKMPPQPRKGAKGGKPEGKPLKRKAE
jgi:hypothetical protein